ncbi:MAG: CcdB family protein [Pseudomonadota bacterium]
MDLQTDLIGIGTTRLVAPLYTHDEATPLKGVTPTVIVGDVTWAVWVPEMAGVPRTGFGAPVASLA